MRFKYLIIIILVILVVIIMALANVMRTAPGAPAIGENDLIHITYPGPNDRISSPLIVRGEARGTWFFEASFPLVLVDWDGRIIAEGHAQAQGDWMTADFVPFEGKIIFTKPVAAGPESERGAVIFKKDNPSGLPEHDAAVEIPIRFK